MVVCEVSGVVFTGNPMNTATDEVVINASWGLGEAVVQGIVTPDQFVIQHGLTPPLELGFVRRDLGQIDECRAQAKAYTDVLPNRTLLLHTPYVPPLTREESADAYRGIVEAFGNR
jgi:phosphoenolpyruvate synthase/pyruvate phosphate dikinase